MILKVLKFTLLFCFIIGLVYVLQVKLFQSTLSDQESILIEFSYLFNFAFTYFFLLNVILFQQKLKDILGFVFLGVSMLKFGIFLFVLNSKNLEISKSDFLFFFIPFVICLGIELFYVARILNSFNYNNNRELE